MIRHPPRPTPFPNPPLSRSLERSAPGERPPSRPAADVHESREDPIAGIIGPGKQLLVPLHAEGKASPGDLDGFDTPCAGDRKSTRLNSSHANISYAVFCLKK